MKALNEFQAKPNDAFVARALLEAYENDSKHGHTSVDRAWELIKPKVQAVLGTI